MGDEQDGDPQLPVDLFQQGEDGLGGLGVQSAGGFVAQQDGRREGQCTGDAHALLLAAGKTADVGVGLVAQLYKLQQFFYPGGALFRCDARQLHGNFNVLGHGAGFQQVELLEHHADLAAHRDELGFGLTGELHAVHLDAAAVGPLQQVCHADEGGFARAGKTDDAVDIAVFHGQAHVLQGFHLSGTADEGLVQMRKFDHACSAPSCSHHRATCAYRAVP